MFQQFFALLALPVTFSSIVCANPITTGEEKISLSSILEAPEHIQIVPGPGLPSLESFNITAVDLVKQAYTELKDEAQSSNSTSTLQRRALICDNGPLAYRLSVRACASYLETLGNTMCRVEAPAYPGQVPAVAMCTAKIGAPSENFIVVTGSNYYTGNPPMAVQSYCRHVARTLGTIEAGCAVNSNWMKSWSQEYAYGNGYLMVRVLGSWKP